MEKEVSNRLTTLGHPQRLAIFRLLMRRYPDKVPAGEIAEALDLRPSTLSAYLSTLTNCGLVSQHRQGTSLRYTVAMQDVRELFDYLFLDCCRGRPEILMNNASQNTDSKDKFNVLFLCTRNSVRSIFAETIMTKLAGDRFNVFSAGTHPSGKIPENTLSVLRHNGHEIDAIRSKALSEFQQPDAPEMDFVFTVCDQAANEDCPVWDGHPISAHWGIPDPLAAEGTDAEKYLAFQTAYMSILNRLTAFTELPISSLDRISLQSAVDQIANIESDT